MSKHHTVALKFQIWWFLYSWTSRIVPFIMTRRCSLLYLPFDWLCSFCSVLKKWDEVRAILPVFQYGLSHILSNMEGHVPCLIYYFDCSLVYCEWLAFSHVLGTFAHTWNIFMSLTLYYEPIGRVCMGTIWFWCSNYIAFCFWLNMEADPYTIWYFYAELRTVFMPSLSTSQESCDLCLTYGGLA